MTGECAGQDNGYLGQTTEIVAAYLGNNTVKVGDIAGIIQTKITPKPQFRPPSFRNPDDWKLASTKHHNLPVSSTLSTRRTSSVLKPSAIGRVTPGSSTTS